MTEENRPAAPGAPGGPTTLEPKPQAGRPRAACPICGRPAETHTRPFCSRRCADIDLARWLNGVYQIPADDPEADPGADPGTDADAAPQPGAGSTPRLR
ncbi:DNA gyrase inhibitor YacG [Arenibaculum pallidiluteum]|uniref:DNA gyrase inhibitor YacG n=1 Tax=Arenibaculum pallidiluteum TaxID=2812559 RepID=UPI001A974EE4|nr:DNA gyrase inhibitor YacG [Arenibaculum pallidiluteum]